MDANAFARWIGPYARRLGNVFMRGKVTGSNAKGRMQTLQVVYVGEHPKSDVEHFEPYGFTSNPLPGAEYLGAAIGGDTSHAVVIVATDRRYRVQELEPGEVAIFTDEGDSIVMKRGRLVEVTTKTLRVNAEDLIELNTKTVQVTASDHVQFTTPDVRMSVALHVTSTIFGTGGFSFSGAPAGGFSTCAGNVNYTAGTIKHNGIVIDSTHRHHDPVSGDTSVPI